MSARERLHVITGGPGSGKTSLIEALARAGYAHAGAGRHHPEVVFYRGVTDLVGYLTLVGVRWSPPIRGYELVGLLFLLADIGA